MAKLVVINQNGVAAVEHELAESWVTIGRADGNAFIIHEASVSGRHCEVKQRGTELVIRDLRSTNGTFVGGQRVTDAVLPAGQTFRVGNVDVRFQVAAPAIPKVSLIPSRDSVLAPRSVIPLPARKVEAHDHTGGRKYQVLFVDDSMAFLDSFARLCGELAGGTWQVHTATNADEALSMMQKQPMDLAVLDIGMPMLDGIQLLTMIRRRYAESKVVMMTALTSEENRTTCLAKGAELFLEKPTSLEGVKLAFNVLHDLLIWSPQKGFSGALQQVSLPDVIQMECLSGKSAILEVRNTTAVGQIYIESGRVVHAAYGQFSGESAFIELLLLQGGQFHLRPYAQPSAFTVSTNWESLLMESSRIRDERACLPTQHPAPPVPPMAAPMPHIPSADHLVPMNHVALPDLATVNHVSLAEQLIPINRVASVEHLAPVKNHVALAELDQVDHLEDLEHLAPVNYISLADLALDKHLTPENPAPSTDYGVPQNAVAPTDSAAPDALMPEPPPAETQIVARENIVIMDGDEEKWLSLGGEHTQI